MSHPADKACLPYLQAFVVEQWEPKNLSVRFDVKELKLTANDDLVVSGALAGQAPPWLITDTNVVHCGTLYKP